MTKHRRSSFHLLGCAFAAVALTGFCGSVALAQTRTSSMNGLKLSNDQPIQIESDKLEIHDQDQTALFTGNVKVVQGTTSLQAGQMTVYYKPKSGAAAKQNTSASVSSGNADIDKILVSQKVYLKSGTQTATADKGIFNMGSQTFVLEGKKVVLSDGPNVFSGCKLTVSMNTGQAQLDSCGQRVQIMLDPKSQQKQ